MMKHIIFFRLTLIHSPSFFHLLLLCAILTFFCPTLDKKLVTILTSFSNYNLSLNNHWFLLELFLKDLNMEKKKNLKELCILCFLSLSEIIGFRLLLVDPEIFIDFLARSTRLHWARSLVWNFDCWDTYPIPLNKMFNTKKTTPNCK